MSSNGFKIVLIGDGAVGKTSAVHRYVENKFSNTYAATIGVDILNTKITSKGSEIALNIWDLAGETHFKSIRGKFYSGTSAAILIFDVTNKKTFNNLKDLIIEVKEYVSSFIPIFLVGNKIDLKHLKQINSDEINNLKNDVAIFIRLLKPVPLLENGLRMFFTL